MECRPNGLEELSAKVSFAISDADEDAAKEKEDEVFWVPHKSDATDFVEDMVEQRIAEEEFRRAEMIEEVAAVGRKNTGFKVEDENSFDGLMTASFHSASTSSIPTLSPIIFSLLALFSLMRGN